MAKWGEGDPRWIVEERPDAVNVNNWHWTEKNAAPWSKDKLKELLEGLDLGDGPMVCKVTEIEKIKGEATANNRKGKLIFFYEWNLNLKWEGRVAGGDGTLFKGNIEVPNLSDENTVNDLELTITLKENSEDGLRLKEFLHKVGREKVRAQLGVYVSSLQVEFSKGMILPSKNGQAPVKPDSISNITSGFNKKLDMSAAPPKPSAPKSEAGVKLDVQSIKLNQTFQCRAKDFYEAMTKIEMVMAFTKSSVTMDPVKNGKFVLFEGNISGEFLELVPGEKIVQHWRYRRWPESHFSKVTIDIKEESDHTAVTLNQTGVPKCDVEMTKQNWERYYWESIKRTFGFGAFF